MKICNLKLIKYSIFLYLIIEILIQGSTYVTEKFKKCTSTKLDVWSLRTDNQKYMPEGRKHW